MLIILDFGFSFKILGNMQNFTIKIEFEEKKSIFNW